MALLVLPLLMVSCSGLNDDSCIGMRLSEARLGIHKMQCM